MSYLDTLLQGVEVEWKTLGEVAELKRGTSITKNTSKEGKYPVISGGQQPAYFIDQFNRQGSTITVAGSGAYAGFVMYWNEPIFVSDAFSIKADESKVFPRYIYHFLLNIQDKIHDLQAGGGVPHVYVKDVARFQIPIPPLPVQEKIVGILDKFTALTEALTEALRAALTASKQQYNYYREQLLSFKEGEVEWKSLGEVAEIGTGSHNTQDAVDNGFYTFYARGIKPLKLNSYDFDETAIITAGDGVGVGKVFHWVVGKYALHQRAYRIVPYNTVSSRYVYHYIITKFYDYIVKTSVSSSVTSMRKPMFLNFRIPIPSLEQQERIVSILDQFDTLTTSIIEGLPKEIGLRKKQYEYFRDLLLTFPSKNKNL